MDAGEEFRARLHARQQSVWELVALSLVLRGADTTEPHVREAALRVLSEAGLATDGAGDDPGKVASEAAAGILQGASILSGASTWTQQDDAALVAQGQASAQAAGLFKAMVVPQLDGLGALLEGPTPTMLDVGVGVAAMAVAWCGVFPELRVVGLDVFPRALELAAETVAGAGMQARIELRHQDVATLEDQDRYALAWLPIPFVPPHAVHAALPRMARSLVPGGWLVAGHGKLADDPRAGAVARLQTAAFGGTAVDEGEAQGLLRSAGLEDVRTLPTPEGAPALTVGRRPR